MASAQLKIEQFRLLSNVSYLILFLSLTFNRNEGYIHLTVLYIFRFKYADFFFPHFHTVYADTSTSMVSCVTFQT